jgi:hypothetical protein
MTIQGYVLDIETSEALIGARVTLLDTEGNKSRMKTQTDTSGYFLMEDPTIQSTDNFLFELIGYDKIKKEASELVDTKILMIPKVEFLAVNQNEADIPLSPTEEVPEPKKNSTSRNLLLLGGLAAVGILAYYLSKNKKS